MNIVLAHGALGAADELIFAGVVVIFLVMMGVSWVRSRSVDLDPETPPAGTPEDQPDSPDRFRLD